MTPLKRRVRIGGNSESNNSSKFNAIAIGTLVSLVIVMLLVFQDKINRLFQDDSSAARRQITIENKTTEALDLPVPAYKKDQDDAEEEDFPERELNNRANFANLENRDLAQTLPEKPIAKEFSSRPPEAVKRTPFQVKPAANKPRSTTKLIQPPSATVEIKASNVGRQFSINRENWILKQNPKYYTLQLLAGYNTATIEKFIRETDISESKMAYYLSTNKGKNWHSLVYGVFPDHSSALAASKKLLKSMGSIQPWIRQLKNVQKDIKPDNG